MVHQISEQSFEDHIQSVLHVNRWELMGVPQLDIKLSWAMVC